MTLAGAGLSPSTLFSLIAGKGAHCHGSARSWAFIGSLVAMGYKAVCGEGAGLLRPSKLLLTAARAIGCRARP